MDTINRFRLSMQRPVSRGMGHTATAAAAYRAGLRIEDERTGEVTTTPESAASSMRSL